MDEQEVSFSVELIRTMLELHRRISELKLHFLTVVESPRVPERTKLELKASVAELAADLDRHFRDSRHRRVSRFNVAEVECLELEYASQVSKGIDSILKDLARLVEIPNDTERAPAADVEINRRLVDNRIYEESALERDKIDHLGAVLGFLLARAGPSPKPSSPDALREQSMLRELARLKVRNYEAGLQGLETQNPDILYKAKSAVERALQGGLKVNVSAGELEAPHLLNHDELYLQDRGNGNLRVFYKERSVCLELDFGLIEAAGTGSWRYRGEITGWAEAGINRVSFRLRDGRSPGTLNPEDPLVSRSILAFLRQAELEHLYRSLQGIRRDKTDEPARRERKVEEEMKQDVARALDELRR
jgi:hypothetical protein